jgi:Raf kinase inhibitor-like YbhB/YbcL family protein
MKFWSESFKDGSFIPSEYAFCRIDPATHVTLSSNKNPHFAWSDVPGNAKSLVLMCVDIDVPTSGDDVNQEGKTVPADLPRTEFFHWTMIDMPVTMHKIEVGQFSHQVTPHGKAGPAIEGFSGLRHGINDYTSWFAGDADMAGQYFGYDGPCPPWNDAIVHRYVFILYALDIEHFPVNGKFTGQEVRDAMRGHILAEEKLIGLSTLNPALLPASV